MAEGVPALNRDGTMEATVKEGNEFLKSVGKEHLITKPEGNGSVEDAEPQLQRDTTIEATVKESEAILKDSKIDEDARTRGDQQRLEEIAEEAKADEPPRIPKDHTMKETAKEGQELLGDAPIGETRSQTRDLAKTAEKDDQEEDEEDEEDGGVEEDAGDDEDDLPNLKRTHTMADTLKEGEDFLKRQKTNGDAVADEAGDA